MAATTATAQAPFFALSHQKTVFCCRHQEAIISHPAIKFDGVKSLISTFIAKLSTDQDLFLCPDSSAQNIEASMKAAKYVIEVERKVDGELQCRYFIESVETVYETPDGDAATRSSVSTPGPSSFAAESYFVLASAGNTPSRFDVAPAVHDDKEEQVYLEVHVKDIFGEKNPALWNGNNLYTFFACKHHQPRVGTSLKKVQALKNPRRGRKLGDGEMREVTGKWLKAGRVEGWGA